MLPGSLGGGARASTSPPWDHRFDSDIAVIEANLSREVVLSSLRSAGHGGQVSAAVCHTVFAPEGKSAFDLYARSTASEGMRHFDSCLCNTSPRQRFDR